jgi:4-hydroxyacetophenone monooxygenase
MNAPTQAPAPAAIDPAEVDLTLLDQGIAQANIPSLLMVLVQLTGDLKWLEPPYAPRRGRGLDDNDSAGLPEETQAEIHAAARTAIRASLAGAPLGLARPDDALLARMLGVSMAEPVPGGYGEIIADDLGLAPPPVRHAPPEGFRAIIIGAGVSGISAAVNLRRLGIECQVFEKNEDFGGTWFENRYPGAGVDTPNLTYTFSFAKKNWSRNFPLRDELFGYFRDTADAFDLRDCTTFGATVQRAVWDDQAHQWQVLVRHADGSEQTHVADVVLSAVGVLNVPMIPAIKGVESFPGEVIHTARWSPDIDVKGKRVAVIGNGASAMQIVPAIAPDVAHMTIFARSKQWAAPFPQFGKLVPDGVRYLMEVVPLYRDWYQQRLTWTFNDRIHSSLFKDPDWAHQQRSLNAVNDGHREFFTRYVREQLGDRQDLLPRVLPDFPPFAKRMLLDNGWYRTITRDNVTLIPEHLAEVEGSIVRAADGQEAEVDMIILATGFRAAEFLGSYEVIGRGGASLHDVWDHDDARAYLGTAIPGFPNFFLLLGPNVGSGHGGSMIRSIECQTHYLTTVLDTLFARGAAAVEVKPEVYEAYARRIDEAHEKMVWTHTGANNWYRNSRGRVIAITPWRNDDFWRMTRQADPADYAFANDASS